MQIVEDSTRNVIKLNPVDHRKDKDDMMCLETLLESSKPRDFLEFYKTLPTIYLGSGTKRRRRLGASFRTKNKKIITIRSTDASDEKVFGKISLHLTRGAIHVSNLSRGIYIYDLGRIENDHRHHLNGPYASICFAFCDFCKSAPLIENIEVGIMTCKSCAKLPLKERLKLRFDNENSKRSEGGLWNKMKNLVKAK